MKPPTTFVKNKSAVIGFSYFGGTALGSLLLAFGEVWIVFFASGFFISVALVSGLMPKLNPLKTKTLLVPLLCFSIGSGVLTFSLHDRLTRQPVLDSAGETLTLSGTVVEKNTLAFYTANYIIETEIAGVMTQIQLTAPENAFITNGDFISAEVYLSHFRNSGIFPERSLNHSRGVLLRGSSDSVELIRHGSPTLAGYITNHNERIRERIANLLPCDNGGLLRAVTLGDSSGLSSELRHNIQVTGLGHLTTVSGLHMTLVAHMFMLLLTPFTLFRNRKIKFATLVIIVLLLTAFFGSSGFSTSVTRSAIMLIIVFGGELFMRKGTTLNSLGFALFILILFSPNAVFDAGLIMSFSGTFGVGVVAPAIKKAVGGLFSKILRIDKLIDAFVISASASLCVLPASVIFFDGFSVLSLITSVILIPFFTLAVASVMLFAFLGVFTGIPIISGSFAEAFLLIAGIMSRLMNALISFLGEWNWGWIPLNSERYWFIPFWLVLSIVTVAIVRLAFKKNRLTFMSVGITIVTLALMVNVYNLHAVRSGRTYITLYSDSVAAWMQVTHGETRLIIATADTPRAYSAIRASLNAQNSPTVLVLLNSVRNNEEAFSLIKSGHYIAPTTKPAIFDISGKFELDVRYSCSESEETVLTLTESGKRILFTRASNENASHSDIVIALGTVQNKREFPYAQRVVYVSRSVPAKYDYEQNVYFEPLYLLIHGAVE
ncbi:MAG: ComEC/Rec2 family competence protein [Oscillospiraceae bacterium]|nr:ComEC/Rec2 family competence protein [Oscillospiraceae bacterium]